MNPYIWIDNLGTWFTHEDYLALDKKLKKGLFPLYKAPNKKTIKAMEEAREMAQTKELAIVGHQIEQLSYKVDRANNIIQMVAESVMDPDSGALWTVNEYLERIANQMQNMADRLQEDECI